MERREENGCILWALLFFVFVCLLGFVFCLFVFIFVITEAVREVSVYLQILLENAELLAFFFLLNFRR